MHLIVIHKDINSPINFFLFLPRWVHTQDGGTLCGVGPCAIYGFVLILHTETSWLTFSKLTLVI